MLSAYVKLVVFVLGQIVFFVEHLLSQITNQNAKVKKIENKKSTESNSIRGLRQILHISNAT